MRFFLFGPRLFHGLVRPGISFGPEDLRNRRLPARAASGYIYVIQANNGTVKIGVTRSPENRLAQIRATSPSKLDFAFLAPVSGDPYALEREAHAMLASHHLHGEWFAVSPELAIAAVAGAAAKLGQSLMRESPAIMIGIGHVVALIYGSAVAEAIAATAGFPTVAGVIFVVYAIIISYISWVSWKAGR